jgi:exonuclease III
MSASTSLNFSRNLYKLHGYLSIPNYKAFEYLMRYRNTIEGGAYGNCATKTGEYAYRLFIPGFFIGTYAYLYGIRNFNHREVMLLTSKVLGYLLAFEAVVYLVHLAAYLCQGKTPYIYLRGEAGFPSLENKSQLKIASWNIEALLAGVPYAQSVWKRLDRIVQKIEGIDADIVILQECLIDALLPEALYEKFKSKYAHFFIHNGPHLYGPDSGLFIMSKYPVDSYAFELFKEGKSKLYNINRGFATLQLKASSEDLKTAFAIIGTHMDSTFKLNSKGEIPSDNDEGSRYRKQQLKQIQEKAHQLKEVKFVILAGDTNINMKDSKAKEQTEIETILHDPFYVKEPASAGSASQSDAQDKGSQTIDPIHGTCTEAHKIAWRGIRRRADAYLKEDDEWHIDQIALVQRKDVGAVSYPENAAGFNLKAVLVHRTIEQVYSEGDEKDPLSDHQALVATINLKV